MIPALIKKCLDAIDQGDRQLVAWGGGSASVNFCMWKNAARAIVQATIAYNQPRTSQPRLGHGNSIKELLTLIAGVNRLYRQIIWDPPNLMANPAAR